MEKTNQKYIGRSEIRREAYRLAVGRGEYVGDVKIPGMLHAVLLRSSHAHARLKRVNVSRAKEVAGVIDVIIGAEVKDILYLPPAYIVPNQLEDDRHCLAVDKVRYVGMPIAVVVAEDRYLGEAALEKIEVEYESLPAVTNMEAALKPNAVKLYEDWKSNVAVTWTDAGGDIEKAFEDADIVVSDTMKMHRHFPSPLEGRAVVADYNWTTKEMVVWNSHQGPYRVWYELAKMLDIPENKLRIMCKDVGGAFGGKYSFFPEDFLIPYLSKKLCRPIQWVEERTEHFMCTSHAREETMEAEMAAKKDGKILGIRGKLYHDQGAILGPISCVPARIATTSIIGPYNIPSQHIVGLAIVTNKAPFGAYRGFGQQNGNYFRECLIDKLAARLSMDPIEIRMKNLIREFPHKTPLGDTYDSGNYLENLKIAAEALGYKEWRKNQAILRSEGRLLGIGVGCYTEFTGWGPSQLTWSVGAQCGGYVGARVRVEPAGTITVYTAMPEQGQGVETYMAQVCADELGVDIKDIKVVFYDTSQCPPSGEQTGGSRGAALGGASVALAARKLINKVTEYAAHYLEVDKKDVAYKADFKAGKVVVKSDEAKFMTLQQAARALYDAKRLPAGMEPGLEATSILDPPDLAWSNGSHLAVVEVDRETFKTEILDYVISFDCGVVINPAAVDGQSTGGLAQVIGAAFSEQLVYDENGQLLTTTFADYGLPRAGDMPKKVTMVNTVSPTPTNVLGVKGMAEGSMIGGYAALGAAVRDALLPLGYDFNEWPLMSSKLYERVKKLKGNDSYLAKQK